MANEEISRVTFNMVRNKKFLAYKTSGRHHRATWSGKDDEFPSPTVIWAKDLKDAQSILTQCMNRVTDYVIVEAKDD